MKGFIEINKYNARTLIALSNIAAVSETTSGCKISLHAPVDYSNMGTSIALDITYEELLELLQAAQ